MQDYKSYGYLEDPTEPYNPDDPQVQMDIQMQVLANQGVFRPLEDRIRDFVRSTKSKNVSDKGEGLNGS